jgi:hypothetical protein
MGCRECERLTTKVEGLETNFASARGLLARVADVPGSNRYHMVLMLVRDYQSACNTARLEQERHRRGHKPEQISVRERSLAAGDGGLS